MPVPADAMHQLIPGQRTALSNPKFRFSVATRDEGLLAARFSIVLVFLEGDSAADILPVYALDGDLEPIVRFDAGFVCQIDLDELSPAVTRVQAILYVVGGAGLGSSTKDLGWIEVNTGDASFRMELENCGHSTLHLVDAYRHDGSWKLLANGQGFAGGLSVIGSRIGVHLDSGHGVAAPPAQAARNGADDSGLRGEGKSASGSGFAVSSRHILTNHHVIEHGRTILIEAAGRAATARVVFSDPFNDLALLESGVIFDRPARFRDSVGLDLGEDVVLVGFPLQNLLGQGLQVTAGNVSGLCGFRNNSTILQYTAPTSSGSSGGPILDQAGLVIGVVRAGLAHDEIRSAGSVSENINFGIKGAIARAFLDAAGLVIKTTSDSTSISRAEIAREARAYAACIKVGY